MNGYRSPSLSSTLTKDILVGGMGFGAKNEKLSQTNAYKKVKSALVITSLTHCLGNICCSLV